MHHLRQSLLWLTLFSIAMGFLESAVVVYLRALYYPHGFEFPLVIMPHTVALTELIREAATIVMLVSMGVIAGRNTAQRFSFFIYSFALWDIFYYVFLKVILDWPSSLFTTDILFLLPVPWVGPVIAPGIVSFTMIGLTLIIIFAAEKENHIVITFLQWVLLLTGAIVVCISFMYDYLKHAAASGHTIWTPMSKEEMFYDIAKYIPQSFNWFLFSVGEALIVLAIASICRQLQKNSAFKNT